MCVHIVVCVCVCGLVFMYVYMCVAELLVIITNYLYQSISTDS